MLSETKPKKVLMIAYTFPPFSSVGGSIRMVKFTKYLPALGWLPVVLTIDDTKEYDTHRKEGSEALLREIPPEVKIFRTGAGEPSTAILEKGRAARRKNPLLAFLVNFLRWVRSWTRKYLLLPDEHITWLPFALRSGRQVIQQEGIDLIFATCPAHSVSLIGAALKSVTGKSLVLDFRDDWIDTPRFQSRPWSSRKIERILEKWAVKTADRVILVTEWSRDEFIKRYPRQPKEKFVYIPNGCDLEDFQFLKSDQPKEDHQTRQFTIVHAGLLSVADEWKRSPEGFFQALSLIKKSYPDLAAQLTVAFTGYLPELYKEMVQSMGLIDMVKEVGHLPKQEFIRSMKAADLLLAINYEGWSTLVPGKIYEYWAVGGPPILLLSCSGAAANFVEQHGLGLTAGPSDTAGIQQAILEVYRQGKTVAPWRLNTAGVEAYDRQAIAAKLAQVLSGLCDRPA